MAEWSTKGCATDHEGIIEGQDLKRGTVEKRTEIKSSVIAIFDLKREKSREKNKIYKVRNTFNTGTQTFTLHINFPKTKFLSFFPPVNTHTPFDNEPIPPPTPSVHTSAPSENVRDQHT